MWIGFMWMLEEPQGVFLLCEIVGLFPELIFVWADLWELVCLGMWRMIWCGFCGCVWPE